jgi:hypothetical protein
LISIVTKPSAALVGVPSLARSGGIAKKARYRQLAASTTTSRGAADSDALSRSLTVARG